MNERKKRMGIRAAVFATALLGVLALAVPGVDAKKKHKGGKSSSVTVTGKTPVAIPPAIAPSGGVAGKTSLVAVPLTVGKKAKKMLVSANSVAVTYSLTGAPGTGAGPFPDGSLWETDLSLAAPNGRTVDLNPPGWSDEDATATGPTTETADSPFFPCRLDNTGVPGTSFCDPTADQDPEGTLKPPSYVGTLGNVELAWFTGVRAKGTWILKARNFDTTKASTLTGISLKIGLTPASGGSNKK
jgi:hypothetical protein